jgi:hypothetical protein
MILIVNIRFRVTVYVRLCWMLRLHVILQHELLGVRMEAEFPVYPTLRWAPPQITGTASTQSGTG